MHEGLYGMLGSESGLAAFKESVLPTVLSLQPPVSGSYFVLEPHLAVLRGPYIMLGNFFCFDLGSPLAMLRIYSWLSSGIAPESAQGNRWDTRD